MVVVEVAADSSKRENAGLGNKAESDEEGTASPVIIPCYNGQELEINQELVTTGLSAISIKHQISPLVTANSNQHKFLDSGFNHRNSFWNLHRPELTKVNWTPFSHKKIDEFFHQHSSIHGDFCAKLHCDLTSSEKELSPPLIVIKPSSDLMHDLDDVPYTLSGERSIQLSDEDLNPVNIVHKSQAQISVTLGVTEATTSTPVLTTSEQEKVEQYKYSLASKHETLLSKISESNSMKPEPVQDNTTDSNASLNETLLSLETTDEKPEEAKDVMFITSRGEETPNMDLENKQ